MSWAVQKSGKTAGFKIGFLPETVVAVFSQFVARLGSQVFPIDAVLHAAALVFDGYGLGLVNQ